MEEGTLCPICETAEDTLDHRMFECSCEQVRRIRAEHLPAWAAGWLHGATSVIHERHPSEHYTHREHTARQLAKQGLARDPSVGQPGPAETGGEADGNTAIGFRGGIIYTDGGCRKLFHPALDRASWAAVATDEDGTVIGSSWGPQWASLPQTSPAAELMGLAAAAQLVPRGTEGWT